MPSGQVTIFICNPEQALWEQLVRESIEEERTRELEADIARETELANEVPIIVEHETIPFQAISDWDFYRLALS